MRITGGIARSLHLKSPKGDFIRPSTDSSRERLFSSLGDSVRGKRVLDLFAGTGACGLEALSRGAASGYFVEKNRHAIRCINKNLQTVSKGLGLEHVPGKAFQADVLKWRPPGNSCFELVFVDPPYAIIDIVAPPLFEILGDWISDEAIVIFEMPAGFEIELKGWEEFKRLGKRGRGDPTQRFLRQA
jgi:16S rRNA (guanine966-N2)-methyltransferase